MNEDVYKFVKEKLSKFSINYLGVELKYTLCSIILVDNFVEKINLNFVLKIIFVFLSKISIFKTKRSPVIKTEKSKNIDTLFAVNFPINDTRNVVDITDIIKEFKVKNQNFQIITTYNCTKDFFTNLGIEVYFIPPYKKRNLIVNRVGKIPQEFSKYYHVLQREAYHVDEILLYLNNHNVKNLVTVQDFYYFDNTITETFKTYSKNTTTYTLQHGVMGKNDGGNAGLYSFVFSDFVCVWGQKSKDLLIESGVEEKKIKLIGTTKIKTPQNNLYVGKQDKIVVLLNSINYTEFMLEVINECKNIGEIFIKPHPSNSLEKIKISLKEKNYDDISIISNLDEVAQNEILFYIGYNTSVTLDIYSREKIYINYAPSFANDFHLEFIYTKQNRQSFQNDIKKIITNEDEIIKNQKNILYYEVFNNNPGQNFYNILINNA